jgi:hypothetical protein
VITLKVDDKLVGAFHSVADCWQSIDDFYEALSDHYSGCIKWELLRDGVLFFDCDFEQYPEGLPAGLWYALAEDAKSFSMWVKLET